MGMCLTKDDLESVGTPAGFALGEAVEWCDPSVSIDSRDIRSGSIFFALKGERTDGHEYVSLAFKSGARCAVVNREWYSRHAESVHQEGWRYLVVHDTVRALQQLASIYRSKFSIPVIGIGGSNGKTTTKEMTAAVLGTTYKVHMSKGNLNNHLGVPLTLFGLRDTHDLAVVEMGINHPGEMELLTSIARPDFALLTNIGHEHLEFLGDLDGVAEAETVLYHDTIMRGGTVFVNTGDARLLAAAREIQNRVDYGPERDGNLIWPEKIVLDPAGRTTFTLCTASGSVSLMLHFSGRHNVDNAVAAAAVGSCFNVPLNAIAEGLGSLVPADGWKRLEFIEAGGIRIFNDTYNANPDSVTMALKTVCEIPCSGRRVLVFADMLELGEVSDAEHRRMGALVAQLPFDAVYTYGEHAALSCLSAGPKCRGHYTSHAHLLDALKAYLSQDDLLLLKGSRGMRLELIAEGLRATDK
ncbi:UDP-N-acetylmuramoylalanyl-D-glutamyl-2,6-diaminopimelate/D-alanyl-D-alanyl ligase [Prosthecochloris aestuarii DSM 271]|uniref:UDP-N-acetylmuramoyl-tripeptide--D-alanyl-D-alanine ligase n=2 Tax=Prosthecochloris aestuarii TaxID=1102 RepID=B4S6R3_PROA2|nr:UDP-N-acetylmuramoylalanyl-D-glutamyl-2,6-diaminopimelate/D-alanyl-D-alanyl ligase [Prosthecochloris aestuarii DSM 271]